MKKTLLVLSLAAGLVANSAMAQTVKPAAAPAPSSTTTTTAAPTMTSPAAAAAQLFLADHATNVGFVSSQKAQDFIQWAEASSATVGKATSTHYHVLLSTLAGNQSTSSAAPSLSSAAQLYEQQGASTLCFSSFRDAEAFAKSAHLKLSDIQKTGRGDWAVKLARIAVSGK